MDEIKLLREHFPIACVYIAISFINGGFSGLSREEYRSFHEIDDVKTGTVQFIGMRQMIEKRLKNYLFLCLLVIVGTGCVPTSEPGVESQPTETISVNVSGQPEGPSEPVVGCAEGGAGVFSPEDVRCYLGSFDQQFVRELDEDTAVLFTNPNDIAEWIGGAIIYHIPTVSTLVLDQFGDVNPQFSQFNGRFGLAALSELVSDPVLMADLQAVVQQNWQTSPANNPEIRLSVAWQDGKTTVFLVSIAGLAAEDDRFYCPGEAWTIGDETIEILSDCMVREEGSLIHHVFFAPMEIKGTTQQLVQLAVNGVPSNVLQVSEGRVSVETAVYQALLQHTGSASVIVRGETLPASSHAALLLSGSVEQSLLDTFLDLNQTSIPLRYLFQGSNNAYLFPGWVIDRDYLPQTGADPDCAFLNDVFPGINGVIGFSQIGYSSDMSHALVFMRIECDPSTRSNNFLFLAQTNGEWEVVQEIPGTPPVLTPSLDFSGTEAGCGDIFVYKPNGTNSEFVTFYMTAHAFNLSSEPLTIDLAATGDEVMITIDLYDDSVQTLGEFPYCNDVGPQAVPQSVWQAVGGSATITVTDGAQTADCNGDPYQTTVRLENVFFRLGEEEVVLDLVEFNGVTVGWCAG
jgi:hypothetical protein